MSNLERLLASKLSSSPSVLLLGQNYHVEYPNVVLADTIKNYKLEESNSYDILFNLNSRKDDICAFIAKSSSELPITNDIQRISSVLWSSVYTSAIDSFVEKIFETGWRTTNSILTDRENYSDLRNPNKLHISYLYGKASQIDSEKLPPFTRFEKSKRDKVADNLLNKLPTIMTTTGVLVIEGFSLYDWLSTETLYNHISSLGTNQTFLFSVTDDLHNDDFIKELIKENKLWVSDQSLADYLRKNNLVFDRADDSNSNSSNKWIRLGDKRLNIPLDRWNNVVRSATVLDENTLVSAPILSKDRLREEFRNFLADSSSQPVWSGYAHEFIFERKIYNDLKDKVTQKLLHNKRDEPIIIHGQAVSGKTVLLGKLAYELFLTGTPILYIDRNRRQLDYDDINDFCEWIESKSSTSALLVIWDGLHPIDSYHKLVRAMQSRGRKVVVLGSCYTQKINKHKSNYIEISVNLDETEINGLVSLLKKHFGEDVGNKIKNLRYSKRTTEQSDAKHLLALLYRHINNVAPTRQMAEIGVYSEAKLAMQNFFAQYILENSTQENPSISDWQQKLIDVKLVTREEIEKRDYEIGDEKYNLPEQLIYTIMSVARLGNLTIPIDIIMRLLGKEIFFSNLMKEIDKQDLLRWHKDDLGNITVCARNEVEAEIILKKNGIDEAKQIDIYSNLLRHINEKNDHELDFATVLLFKIGPNGDYKIGQHHYYKIAMILAYLRENYLSHPRLMLQEAYLLREIVVFKTKNPDFKLPLEETEISILDKAEAIVQEALSIPRSQSQVFLRVELATIYGYKIKYVEKNKRKEYYELVKKTVYTARLQNPDTYHALDIAVRATENVLDNLTDPDKLEARVYFLDLFEAAELEGIRVEESERYYSNQQKVYSILGESALSEEAFQQLCASGSKSGYYLRALDKLSNNPTQPSLLRQPLTNANEKNIQSAYNYLDDNYKEIFSNQRCLNLYFKLWWLLNNKRPLFYQEKDILIFDNKQWSECTKLVHSIIALNEPLEIPAPLLFIKGLCEFHTNSSKSQYENTFKELSVKTDYADTRRIKTWYFACEQQKIKEYSGVIDKDLNIRTNQKGQVYCEELRLHINFQLSDFGKSKLSAGDKINFMIAFNYRGILAQPIKKDHDDYH